MMLSTKKKSFGVQQLSFLELCIPNRPCWISSLPCAKVFTSCSMASSAACAAPLALPSPSTGAAAAAAALASPSSPLPRGLRAFSSGETRNWEKSRLMNAENSCYTIINENFIWEKVGTLQTFKLATDCCREGFSHPTLLLSVHYGQQALAGHRVG